MRFGDFPGHFPGEPLVPGAALLDAVARSVRAEGKVLVGVRRVRFLEPVYPGEEVEVHLRRAEGRLTFEVVGGGRVRMRGVGVEGEP